MKQFREYCAKKTLHCLLSALFLVCLFIKLVFYPAGDAEENVHIDLTCDGDACMAVVNHGAKLRVDIGPGLSGERVGIYIFHRFEGNNRQQYFREMSCQLKDDPRFVAQLISPKFGAPNFDLSDGWTFEPGKGITHFGEEGTRAIAWVENLSARVFSLNVDISGVTDAGIVFRADDSGEGIVFVVRPDLNDAFFFRIKGAQPGPIIEIIPLEELRFWKEIKRLGGLIADLGLRTCIFLAILWVLIKFVAQFSNRLDYFCVAELHKTPGVSILFCMFVAAFIACAYVSFNGLFAVPHITDETSCLFQARIFAHGKLWATVPKLPEFFTYEHVIMSDGRWFSKYPPLFSGLLALGLKFGAHSLVNPFLGAITALIVFFIAKEVSNSRSAFIAWFLTVSSPFFLFIGASLMSHMASALFLSSFVLFAIRGMKYKKLWYLLVSSASLGMAIFVRPYTAFLYFLPVFAYFFIDWFRSRGNRLKAFQRYAGFAVVLAVFVLLYLCWNSIHTGAMGINPGLHEFYDATDTLGFGLGRGTGQRMTWGSWGHTPAKAIRSVYRYFQHTSRYMFGWPWKLSFAFVLVPFFLLRGKRPLCWFLISPWFALVIGHMFYWATEHIGFGARYWFSAFPNLAVLSAIGVESLIQHGIPDIRGAEKNQTFKPSISLILARTLHEQRAMFALRAVMWRLCRHKRGLPRSFCRIRNSTKRHVLWHPNLQRKLLCQSRLLHELDATRAITGLGPFIVGILIMSNLIFYFPGKFSCWVHRHSYGNVKLQRLINGFDQTNIIIFVKTDSRFYFDGLFINDPFMASGRIIARDLGEKNKELLNLYPDYAGYVWDGEKFRPMRYDRL